MFNLFFSINDIFNLSDNFWEGEGWKFGRDFDIINLNVELDLIDNIHEFFKLYLLVAWSSNEVNGFLRDIPIWFVFEEHAQFWRSPCQIREHLLEKLLGVILLHVSEKYFKLGSIILHRLLHSFQKLF